MGGLWPAVGGGPVAVRVTAGSGGANGPGREAGGGVGHDNRSEKEEKWTSD